VKQVEHIDGGTERTLLIGLIVDSKLLKRIAPKWEGQGLFNARWSNLIAGWCLTFLNKYDRAPGKAIQSLFQSWAIKTKDNETIQIIETFLRGLSEEYEDGLEMSTAYLIDLAGQHFNKVRLKQLNDEMTALLETGKTEEAEERRSQYRPIALGIGSRINVLEDQDAIREAFESRVDPMVVYPGALGNFFGASLERGAFVAFWAPEKRGKSYWLLDLAWRAMQQKRRVAFFEVGDLGKKAMMQRFMVRASRQSFEATIVKIPKYIERVGSEVSVDHKKRDLKGLEWDQAAEICVKTTKEKGRDLLTLSCHPAASISVAGIETILQEWEQIERWVPDVVIIDYADILAPISAKDDVIERINRTWMALRALSQKRSCLVVTASQTKAASYKAETLDMSHFSGDKRKLAHVTGMVGINSTPAEQREGLMRLNWIVRRESEFDPEKCVYVAGCLAIANPAMKSTF
jgi:hypothetical protein